MKLFFDYKFIFYMSKMNEICLHCHWLYFSSITMSFGEGVLILWHRSTRNTYRKKRKLITHIKITFDSRIWIYFKSNKKRATYQRCLFFQEMMSLNFRSSLSMGLFAWLMIIAICSSVDVTAEGKEVFY